MKKIFLGFAAMILLTTLLITIAITGEVAKDPVCNMDVDVAKATIKVEGKNGTVYFCSEYCKDKFKKDPSTYLSAAELEKLGIVTTTKSVTSEAKSASPCAGCEHEKEHTGTTTQKEAAAPDATGCDGKCGTTKVKEVNDFHTAMHSMETAINADNIEMVKSLAPVLEEKKALVMKASCPEGKCSSSFESKRAELSKKVDSLVAACEKNDAGAIKAAFQQMHDAYTTLDHAAR
jgi:YHS domain-containing protein